MPLRLGCGSFRSEGGLTGVGPVNPESATPGAVSSFADSLNKAAFA